MTFLLISTCKEKLHELEFVKPIEQILKKNIIFFTTIHYTKLTKKDISDADKIIICGTSLKDKDYQDNLSSFNFIKDFKKPILGICAGMQILILTHNGKTKTSKEIGQIKANFKKEFLGLKEEQKIYALHSLYIESPEFEVFAKSSNCPQAVKHKQKEIYGVLFHPEVMNREMITEFCKL
jgi:GMP synthase (glutamine-hydrolysing)